MFPLTCMLVCAYCATFGTRDRGCSVHPAFPAPSVSREGQRDLKNSGKTCREIARSCLVVIASEAKQSTYPVAALWIASAFALRRFGKLPPCEACAASEEGSSQGLLAMMGWTAPDGIMCQTGDVEFDQTREPSMNEISMIGLDLAKNVFQVHGVDASGKVVLRRQFRRGAVEKFFAKLSPSRWGWRRAGARITGLA